MWYVMLYICFVLVIIVLPILASPQLTFPNGVNFPYQLLMINTIRPYQASKNSTDVLE